MVSVRYGELYDKLFYETKSSIWDWSQSKYTLGLTPYSKGPVPCLDPWSFAQNLLHKAQECSWKSMQQHLTNKIHYYEI